MSDVAQPRIYYYPQSTAPETPGYRVLRWGALIFLIIETISVGDGIFEAIMMTLHH